MVKKEVSFFNRCQKREQRLLADYAPQVGGKASEGGLKGR